MHVALHRRGSATHLRYLLTTIAQNRPVMVGFAALFLVAGAALATPPPAGQRQAIVAGLGSLPFRFEANEGQLGGPQGAPPDGPWLQSAQIPGFQFKALIAGGTVGTRQEADCVPSTLCISGAVPGRSELFLRIVGPKPNGFLWPNIVRFTTAQIEVWVQRTSSQAVKYYLLPTPADGSSDLSGLFDSHGFLPGAPADDRLGLPVAEAAQDEAHLLDETLPVFGAEAPPPPSGAWLTTSAIPGFRFQVRTAGATPRVESDCVPQTLCISSAARGRTELFVRILGPKPNGYLWPHLVKFSLAQFEVWIQKGTSGPIRYYTLGANGTDSGVLTGLFDELGFQP